MISIGLRKYLEKKMNLCRSSNNLIPFLLWKSSTICLFVFKILKSLWQGVANIIIKEIARVDRFWFVTAFYSTEGANKVYIDFSQGLVLKQMDGHHFN